LLVLEIKPNARAFASALPGFLSVSLADRASESATSPVEIAVATESDTQSTQPVPELDVADASPCKTPTPTASALDVTSPVSDALDDVDLATELMPARETA
jgi:hypothetical protein